MGRPLQERRDTDVTSAGGCGAEFGRLTRVVVKSAREAFVDEAKVAREWEALRFLTMPGLAAAEEQYAEFLDAVASTGAEILSLPSDPDTTLDSIYVRDASVVCAKGAVLCRMGKSERAAEPEAQARAFTSWGVPIAGTIQPPGQLEGGDVVWLDDRTVAVGRGYRTNDDGIGQLRTILGDTIDELLVVPLPHWRGPADVFHLMSIISPVDRDLAVVYAPLLPVPFRGALVDRGLSFVDVPDEEFDSMGANVLAIAPRTCVMVEGNPRTQAALVRAGATVRTYAASEISLKGGGGPTCLTRPIGRAPTA